MLLSFAVTNFRSIKERCEISMLKSGLSGHGSNYIKCENKKHVLKSAIIYGPNASGKSNVLQAIKALEYLVLRSGSHKPEQKIGPYEPYSLDRSHRSKPVEFEISFVYEKRQYDYFLSFTSTRIEAEELYFYQTNTKSLLFARTAEKEMKFGDYYKGVKKTIEKLLLPNQLFLSKAAENNVESLISAYSFFDKTISAFPTTEGAIENNITSKFYAKWLAESANSTFAKRFNALICALDTGIASVSAKEVEWKDSMLPGSLPEDMKKQIREDFKYEIKTQHPVFEAGERVGYETFDIHEESAGTQSLFFIGGIIIDALENGRALVVDEFEKNLHPRITHFLIQLFHNPEINRKRAQLIFATHDVTQLSHNSFRRDQVWFVNKDDFGETTIERCSDIEGLRLGTPIDKWYATGRLRAIPKIDDVKFLIEMQSDESDENS